MAKSPIRTIVLDLAKTLRDAVLPHLGAHAGRAHSGEGAGGDVTFYEVPEVLKPTYGDRPVSVHVFFRVRPPAPMGRMLDSTMTRHKQ